MKTKVLFLVNETDLVTEMDGVDVYAFFPELDELGDCCLSYAHIGQHSACCWNYANESRLATENEYKDLYKELTELVGYDLEIVHNF